MIQRDEKNGCQKDIGGPSNPWICGRKVKKVFDGVPLCGQHLYHAIAKKATKGMKCKHCNGTGYIK